MEAIKDKIQALLDNEDEFNTKFEETFTKFDENKNDVLEKSEVKNVILYFFEKMGTEAPSDEKISEMIAHIDTNKDEVISREELKSWVLHMFKKIAGAQ